MEEFLLFSDKGKKTKEGIRVILQGNTNVGKSSIMNAMMRENRSIVTSEAGTTRDTIQETIFIQGISFFLSDTARYSPK